MTDFEQRLQKAIERGHRTSDNRARAEAEKAMSDAELRRLHTQCRLELSEHIEGFLRKLSRHFPGFQFDPVVSDRGWGAAVSRDDVVVRSGGRRGNYFSRLEMLIRPASEVHVLDLAAKGTIRNKEVFNRNHYQRLAEILRSAGFDVVYFGNASDFDNPRTRVIARVGTGGRADSVAGWLRVDRLESDLEPTMHLDATIVLGADWRRRLRLVRGEATEGEIEPQP